MPVIRDVSLFPDAARNLVLLAGHALDAHHQGTAALRWYELDYFRRVMAISHRYLSQREQDLQDQAAEAKT